MSDPSNSVGKYWSSCKSNRHDKDITVNCGSQKFNNSIFFLTLSSEDSSFFFGAVAAKYGRRAQPERCECHEGGCFNEVNLTNTGGRGATTMERRCAQKGGTYQGGGIVRRCG